MAKLSLSVVIIAKNEEQRIEECIRSVYDLVDDIVVIDDHSTDSTVEIAKKYTNNIHIRKMGQEGVHRNFGASKAKNDWIFILDCDERPTPELIEEIKTIMANINQSDIKAFWVPQHGYIGDVELKYGGWSSGHLRIYHRQYVSWSEKEQDVVHPGIVWKPDAKAGSTKGRLNHYMYRNLEDFYGRVNRYTTLEAVKWHLDGRQMTLVKAIWRMVDRFFRRFIGKKGYKDGFYGFMLALLSGVYEIVAYAKYWELKNKGYYIDRFKK